MEQQKQRQTKSTSEGWLPLLGGAFLLGAVAGSLCCARMDGLQAWLSGLAHSEWTFLRLFLPQAVLLAAMALCAFLRAGRAAALLLTAIYGFFLSARTAVAVAESGGMGYARGLVQELLPGFLALTALLLLGRQAMHWSAARRHRPAGKGRALLPDRTYGLTVLLCLAIMALSAALRLWLTPVLWQAASLILLKT